MRVLANKKWLIISVLLGVFFGVFAFGFLSRLPAFDVNDEGYYLRLATERLYDLPHPFSFAQVTSVYSLYPETPLYSVFLSAYFSVAGLSVTAGRALSSIFLLLIVGLVILFSYRVSGKYGALLSAVAALGAPHFWFFGRLVLPHAFIVFLVLLSLFLIYEYRHQGKNWILCAGIGIAVVSIFVSYWSLLYCVLLPFLLLPYKHKIRLLAFLPLFSLGLYWLSRLLVYGELFIQDFQKFLAWMQSGDIFYAQTSILGLALHVSSQYALFLLYSPIYILSLIGIFFIKDRWVKWSLIILFIFGGLYIFRDRSLLVTTYIVVLIIPFGLLGISGLVEAIRRFCLWLKFSFEQTNRAFLASALLLFVVGVATMIYLFYGQIRFEAETKTGAYLLTQGEEAAEFVNKHADADAYVVANLETFWMIEHPSMNYLWLYFLERSGFDSEYANYFWKLDSGYYSRDLSLTKAQFVVDYKKVMSGFMQSDPLFRQVFEPTLGWPIVFENIEYRIYENPRYIK